MSNLNLFEFILTQNIFSKNLKINVQEINLLLRRTGRITASLPKKRSTWMYGGSWFGIVIGEQVWVVFGGVVGSGKAVILSDRLTFVTRHYGGKGGSKHVSTINTLGSGHSADGNALQSVGKKPRLEGGLSSRAPRTFVDYYFLLSSNCQSKWSPWSTSITYLPQRLLLPKHLFQFLYVLRH